MVEIRELTEEKGLAELLSTQPLQPFLQSWAWGEFQKGLGRRIWRLGAFENKALVGAALVIEHQLILGKSYVYCPRGPLATGPDVAAALLKKMAELGKETGAMYAKIDPGLYAFDWSAVHQPASVTMGTTLQPRQTWLIDTSQTPDDILTASHQKTRYNVRLAEKRGVTVRWSTEDADVKIFLGLMHQTAKRQGIRLHSDTYYQKQFSILSQAKMAEFAIAELDGQPLAANMIIWHDQTATYLHGGSSDEHSNVMAPHLLQWRTIEQCHQRGVTTYDLWGVAPADQSDHHWQGISRFKKGFAGREQIFPAALNIILQPQWYQTYRWVKRIRGGVDE